MLPHLSVRIGNRQIRHQLLHMSCYLIDIFHTVIDIVYLPLSCAFPFDCFTYHLVIIFHNICLDRHTVIRCFLQYTHIANTDQAHMKCSRDWSRCKCQYIYIFLQFLDFFFVLNTEPLFFIDDQEPQIFEFQVFTQYPMCSDNDIYQSLFRILDRLFLLCRCTESAHQVNPHRELFHTLYECPVMLLCKNRCRNQIDYLLTLLYSFECRTDCNLRLTKSNIPTDQTIHDLMTFHIFFYSLDRHHLIFRLFKRKHLFKFSLPYCIFSVDITILLLSCRIQLHQISCNLFYGTAHPGLGPIPLLGSQLIQLWFLCIGTGIFLYQIQLCCRDIEIPALCIRDFHIIF